MTAAPLRFAVSAARLFAMAGGALLLLIVAITTLNALAFGADRILRVIGGAAPGLAGYEDVVRLVIGAASPLFLPYCQARRGHLAVDLFTARAPTAVKRGLDAAGLAMTAAAAAFLAYWMAVGMLETRADGALSRVLGWPEWPFYAPGIAALALWALIALLQLIYGDAADAPEQEASHG